MYTALSWVATEINILWLQTRAAHPCKTLRIRRIDNGKLHVPRREGDLGNGRDIFKTET